MYEKLSSRIDFENAFKKKGYIVIHRSHKPIKDRTIIHDTSCKNLKAKLKIMFPKKGDSPKNFTNKQEYRYYDSYNEIKSDFEHNARPCKHCNHRDPQLQNNTI